MKKAINKTLTWAASGVIIIGIWLLSGVLLRILWAFVAVDLELPALSYNGALSVILIVSLLSEISGPIKINVDKRTTVDEPPEDPRQ